MNAPSQSAPRVWYMYNNTVLRGSRGASTPPSAPCCDNYARELPLRCMLAVAARSAAAAPVLRVPLLSRPHRRREDLLGVHHLRAAGPQVVGEPERLHLFEGDQQVRLSRLDQRRVDLRTEAQVGRHGPPALRHPVHLAFLDVESREEKRLAKDLGCQQGPLPADPCEENVALRHAHGFLSRIAWNLHRSEE